MSADKSRSLLGRLRSLTRRDRAGSVQLPAAAAPARRTRAADAGAEAAPVWSIVANVVDDDPYGPGGPERRQDLKVFAPGAKVYVVGRTPAGSGLDVVSVVGRGRKASRFVTAQVRSEHLETWRVELVYSPAVLRRIAEGGYTGWAFASPSRPLDPSGDEYRFELLDLAARFTRHNLQRAAGGLQGEAPNS